jgi:large subunit ribosomal protein L21
MYAIVEIAGKQFKVEPDATLYVPFHAEASEGDAVTFDRVLLVGGDSTTVGAPTVAGASVEAKVLGHVRGDKIIVFKKKRRKRYRRTRGHRQDYTQIQITAVNAA